MKIICQSIIYLLVAINCFAQDTNTDSLVIINNDTFRVQESKYKGVSFVNISDGTTAKVYQLTEQMPQPDYDVYSFLQRNLRHPKNTSNTTKRVAVRFIVASSGDIIFVSVAQPNPSDSTYEAEAIRVVKAMPKWNPAKHKGQPVWVWYILPVSFKN